MKQTLAIKITRRGCALAVFENRTVAYVEHRTLAADFQKAKNTIESFLAWGLSTFSDALVAIEALSTVNMDRSSALSGFALSVLQAKLMPVQQVPTADLFKAFSLRGLKTRQQLRVVSASLWPHLANRKSHPSLLDAAALGFYIEVEWLLNH